MSRNTKKLLIQFEYDERTRWLCSPGELARSVQIVTRSVAICHSAGAIPAITVTEEEHPETTKANDSNT